MLFNASWRTLAAAIVAAAPSALAVPALAGELVYWSMWNETEPQATALKKIMDAYTAAHPDTTFSVVWNGRQNQTKLRTALQAGTAVDFMDQDSDQLAGGLQKDGLARDIASDLSPETKAAFLPGTLELFADGERIYQIPYTYNTVNFWYDRDMLAEVGGAVPSTFDDLLALCGKVKDAGKHALVIEGNVAFYNALYFSHHLSRLKGPGAKVTAFENKTGAGWSDPAVLEAAKASRALWDAGCIAEDARGFQYPAGQQTIPIGDSLGELVGSWLPTELAESAGPDFNWGAFNYPEVSGGAGKSTDIEVGLLSFVVLKDAPNAKEAVDFLSFVMSEEAQKMLVSDGGVGVTRSGVAWPEVLSDAYASASAATSLSPFGGGLNLEYPEFTSQVFNPEFNKMFLGETTPEDFVATLISETKKYWDSH